MFPSHQNNKITKKNKQNKQTSRTPKLIKESRYRMFPGWKKSCKNKYCRD